MTEPTPPPAPTSFLDSLGARALYRAEPRASIAVAGAGCALAVLGVLIISGDTGASGDGFSKWPGVLLCAAVVAAGYFVLSRFRTGALATGGVVAAALGVPPLMVFLTWSDSNLPPYSSEAVLIVSTAVWLGSYAVGPGRGRPFFLGAGLFGLWFTVLQMTEKIFDAPFTFFGGLFLFRSSFADGFDEVDPEVPFGSSGLSSSFEVPDISTIGIISLIFGAAYVLVSRRLDQRGHRGIATPFLLPAVLAIYGGTIMLSGDLEQAGTGLALMVIGLLLSLHGGSVWRRATTWIGGGFTTVGAGLFLSDMSDDALVAGLLFLAAGVGLVFGGHVWALARNEPDEMLITAPAVVPAAAPTTAAPIEDPGSPPTETGDV